MTVLSQLEEIRGKHVYELARLAEVASPNTPESPGAKYLDQIRQGALEILAADDLGTLTDDEFHDSDVQDAISEYADTLVPVYTHEVWQVFTDLAAWNEEDETGLMEVAIREGHGMTQIARIALYRIAERLLQTLIREDRDV